MSDGGFCCSTSDEIHIARGQRSQSWVSVHCEIELSREAMRTLERDIP